MIAFETSEGMRSEAGTPARRRAVRLALGALLLWSLAVRVWFGSTGLNPTRFWDERYGLENIAALLETGELRPANGFHPSLSYLPQAAVLAATEQLHRWTGRPELAVFAARGFSATSYLLCRLLQALFGVASIYLLFVIGRRLAGPETGLIAALLLAAVPWHIRQSAIFKPDILLVLTLLVAFLATLRAIERPGASAYAAAGAAVGVALSSKFNAGPIALPLTVAALWHARSTRRALLWLLLAGACAVAVFLLLNPYALLESEIYERSMGRTLRDYARKGHRLGGDGPLAMPLHALSSLLSERLHGALAGALGLAGLAIAPFAAARSGGAARALPWAVAGVFPAAYVLFYTVATTNPSEHNWLPLTPFTALGAGWLVASGWQALQRRWPLLRRRAAAAPLLAGGLLAVVVPAQLFAYRSLVPTTGDEAGHLVARRLGSLDGRLLVSEVEIAPAARRAGDSILAYRRVERLDALPVAELDLADAELLPAGRLREDGSFYASRLARAGPSCTVEIAPRLFRARGTRLFALMHPLERAGAGRTGTLRRLPGEASLYASELLDALEPEALVSIELWLPALEDRLATASLRVGGRELPLVTYRLRRKQALHLSPRFRSSNRPLLEVRTPEGVRRGEEFPYRLRRWRLPARPCQESGRSGN